MSEFHSVIRDARHDLLAVLAAHAAECPEQAARAVEFAAFVAAEPRCALRELATGHLTASAWLVSADGERVLLTHHAKLGRWLQLGGHADGELDLAAVALREAVEESGLPGLAVDAGIFDLDRHWIPERGGEPGHWHWDVRHVVRCGAIEAFVVSAESLALAWRPIAALVDDPDIDASIRRMARRWVSDSRAMVC
jgi:8-oxo-dGTP pyrophosphatase MutT (NUDIX family)